MKAKRDAAALAKAEKEAKDQLASLAAKKARAEKKQAAQAVKAAEKLEPASVLSVVSVSSKTDLATTESAETARQAEEKAEKQRQASSTENSGAQAAPALSPKSVKFSGKRGDSSRLKAAQDPEAKSRDWFCLDSNPYGRSQVHSDGQAGGNILRKGSRFMCHGQVSKKHDVWMFSDRGGFYKLAARGAPRRRAKAGFVPAAC